MNGRMNGWSFSPRFSKSPRIFTFVKLFTLEKLCVGWRTLCVCVYTMSSERSAIRARTHTHKFNFKESKSFCFRCSANWNIYSPYFLLSIQSQCDVPTQKCRCIPESQSYLIVWSMRFLFDFKRWRKAQSISKILEKISASLESLRER